MKKRLEKYFLRFAGPLLLALAMVSFQFSKFTLIKSISTIAKRFDTDNLGNAYLINGSTLEKYGPDGSLLKTYSNKNLGTISGIDATNALKTLVFYESFQQVTILDNMLAPAANPIQFEAIGYNQVSLICSSINNGLWLYNKQNSELIHFDQNLQKNYQTGNLSQQVLSSLNPNFLTEQNNKVFLNDSAKGILVFDIYGAYNKTIPLKGLKNFQLNNDRIIFFKDNKLKSYDTRTLEVEEMEIPDLQIIDARTEKEKLYLLKQKSLAIYTVNNEK